MAGILAPTLSDIGGAGRGVGGVRNDSIATGINSLSSLLDSFSRSSGSGGPSQQDRDNSTLQPIAEQLTDLELIRPNLPVRQYTARRNAILLPAYRNSPGLTGDINRVATSITGDDIGAAEGNVDLVNTVEQANAKYVAEDPAGIAAFQGLAVYNEDRSLNTELTQLNISQFRAQDAADAASLAKAKMQLELEKTSGQVDEVREEKVMDQQANKFGQMSQQNVEGIVQAGLAEGFQVSDADAILGSLRQGRAQVLNMYESAARQGGFANNPKFNSAIAVAPYDNLIELVTERQKDLPLILERLGAASSISLGKLIAPTLGDIGYNRDVQRVVIDNIVVNNLVSLDQIVKGMEGGTTIAALSDTPLFTDGGVSPVSADNPPDLGGPVSDEGKAASAALSDKDRTDEARAGITNFNLYSPESGTDEGYRTTVVTSFTLATTAMNTSNKPTSEGTFDRAYSSKFFDTYTDITKFGDETAARLQSAVAENLSTIYEQRKKITNDTIANNFSNDFPGMELTFGDNKVAIGFASPVGSTEAEKVLFSEMKARGIPMSLEGLTQFRKEIKGDFSGRFVELSRALTSLDAVEKEVGYLNKVVGTMAKIPDLSPHLIPRVANDLKSIPLASTPEEWEALVPSLTAGDRYYILGEDGERILVTKGKENELFVGEENGQ